MVRPTPRDLQELLKRLLRLRSFLLLMGVLNGVLLQTTGGFFSYKNNIARNHVNFAIKPSAPCSSMMRLCKHQIRSSAYILIQHVHEIDLIKCQLCSSGEDQVDFLSIPMMDLSERIVLYLRERVHKVTAMGTDGHEKNGYIGSNTGQDGIC